MAVKWTCIYTEGGAWDFVACPKSIIDSIWLNRVGIPTTVYVGRVYEIRLHYYIQSSVSYLVALTPEIRVGSIVKNASMIELCGGGNSLHGKESVVDLVFDKPGTYKVYVSPDPRGLTPITVEAVIKVCDEGAKRSPAPCWDGSKIYREVCKSNKWVPSGEVCPVKICNEGEKRNLKTCLDRSTIYEQLCMGNKWVPTGETCQPEPAAGAKRNPTTCWDGSVIHAEKYDATLKQWVPTGETPPPKPECTEGDKKAGYVCVAGKWQTAPAVPEPVVPEPVVPEPVVPPVTPTAAPPKYLTPEEADERVRAGLPCYIKCTLPILDLLPWIPYTPGMWVPPFCAITTEP